LATGRDSQVIIDSSTKDSQKITSQSTAIFCQALTKTISSFKILRLSFTLAKLKIEDNKNKNIIIIFFIISPYH